MIIGWVVLGLVILSVGYGIFVYNRLVGLRNQVDEAWSGIDVQLKRRYDLIPNLVETVKGYAKHEQQTLEKVIQARNMAMQATGIEDKIAAENQLASTLKTLFALSENYPDLKANTNFLDLQKNLADIEEQISLARRYYNAVTRDFNILCETFPSVIIANMTGFRKRPFFEAAEGERQNVKVQF
ncbi:LemA family protein [Thermospira aquatica]|uniref:LemA family protein n=1 Tax=Thermospira aquatica TaxID=2828656 RepID=A0AAX3BG86_9SPIR|nr:LemA family protein [Thermospira aquatica]URA11291.1 LemA family protein [Thermospira aquatica]